MNEKIIDVDISNLFLNEENPRFSEPTSDQRAAIYRIMKKHEEKITNLARDIAKDGLSAIDNVAVTRAGHGQFVVREGNRRVVAVKLLAKPELLQDYKVDLVKMFQKIREQGSIDLITNVRCVLYTDEDLLNKFIKLKHTGENNGVGVDPWTTLQKRRFEEKLGKHVAALRAIDFIRNNIHIPEDIKDNVHKISVTNLERLIGDPYVKAALGINTEGKEFYTNLDDPIIRAALIRVLSDLTMSKKFKVQEIYYKKDRETYIDSVIQRVRGDIDDADASQGLKIPSGLAGSTTDTAKGSGSKSKRDRRNPISTKRTTLIPSACVIKIDHKRLNIIYHELRDLNVEDKTNAYAVLFRTFVELSVDVYCNKHKVPKYSDTHELRHKVKIISEYLVVIGKMTKKELKPIEMLSEKPTSTASVNTFNAYVHNPDVNPIPNDLKRSWDNIERFIQVLFN